VVDRDFYDKVAEAPRTSVNKFTLPIRSGRAWFVRKGQVCRLSTPEGAQVGDLNIWNAHNPRERMWAARTRQLQAAHVTKYDRLWSCLPYMRPLVTIVADTLEGYGDDVGGRVHDLLGTRCDPYVGKMLSGNNYDFHCHSNLTRAVLPFGLGETDVHDVLNVFQVTGLNLDDKYYMRACPAKPGDYFEFFAEQDILCALSTCPGGDLSKWSFGASYDSEEMVSCCRPLGVEVYELNGEKGVLEDWTEPANYDKYKGNHGLTMPVFKTPE